MANSVYDPEQPTDDNSPGSGTLHKNPAQPPKDSGSQEDLRNAESSGDGFYNPQGDGSSTGSSATTGGLAAAEGGSATGTAGGFNFNPKDSTGSGGVNNMIKVAAKHKKGIGVGVGVGGGLVGIALTVFFLLVPLKIEHIVSNLQNRFFSSSQDAVGKETNNLLKGYITKALPSYQDCGSTLSKNCTADIKGTGPVNNLYRTWANARLENKLATNYGVEFKYNKYNKNWYLKAPGSNPGGDNIGPNGQGLDSDFQRADRATMRNAINDAMQNETRWKQVMYRYKVGRLLEGKYGIKRCIIFCGTKDALADQKDKKKLAAQLYLVQRVVGPRNQSLGIVIQCLLDSNCVPEDTQPTQISDQEGGYTERENPATDTAVRTALVQLASTYGLDDADKLVAQYTEISDKGFQKYIAEKVFEKIGLSSIASQAADAIPIVNIITSASNAISLASNAGPAITKLGYITNASAAVSTYMLYRSYSDEIHTGHTDATELGSMNNSLGPGNPGSASDPEKGGTASAEQTPLYQNIIDGNSPPAAQSSLLNSILPGKAYAASNGPAHNSNDYICANGKPVPAGQLVCSEEVLGQSNSSLDAAHQFLALPGVNVVTSLAHGVAGFTGTIGSLFGGVIQAIPGVGSAINSISSLVGSVLQPFFEKVITVLIPSPFGSNMSGGRKFDMMAAGSDVSGNDYANTGLGGQQLTPTQAAKIINGQQNEAEQTFSHQSLFARMFSTDSQYSLVSKVAMDVPFGTQAAAQSSLASLLNPLSAISHGFGSMLSGQANAAVAAQPDPFGVTQYGYPDGTIPTDPEAYWNAHCSDNSAQSYQNDHDFQNSPGGKGWVGTAANDPTTGMPVNHTTNPCLLIKATVGSAGGLFDTSNLTSYDLADQQQSAGGTVSATAPVSGNAQQLAQQILSNGDIDLSCLSSSVKQDVQDAAAGKPGTAGAPVSSAILQLIATVGQDHQVCVTAIESDGQGHATGSYHYTGDAVDFGSLDGVIITGRNAPAQTIIKIAEQILPSGSALGQSQCGSTPSLPSGWTTFDDTCNHLHVQVPRGTK